MSLPSYNDEVHQPLLGDIKYPLDESTEVLVVGTPDNKVGCARRSCFFGRMRARCAERRAARRAALACENPACQKVKQRRRRFALFTVGILGLIMGFHAFKHFFNHPDVSCVPITNSSEVMVEVPFKSALNFHYSLTGGDTTIVHDSSAPKGNVTYKVEFEPSSFDGEDGEDKVVLCTAVWKRAVGAGVFTKKEGGLRPLAKSLTITLPTDVDMPRIKFGGKADGDRAERMLRRWLKWHHKCHKKTEENVESE